MTTSLPEEYLVNLETKDLKTYLKSLPEKYIDAILLQDHSSEDIVERYHTLENLKEKLTGQIERQENVIRKIKADVDSAVQKWKEFDKAEEEFLMTLPTLYEENTNIPFKVYECKKDEYGNIRFRQEACEHWFVKYSGWWCSSHQYMTKRGYYSHPPDCKHCIQFRRLRIPVVINPCPCEEHENVPKYCIEE